MNSPKVPNILSTRRRFIRNSAYASMGATAIGSVIRDLRLINSALAVQSPLPGYKALVCIFLGGGNDANNWIVPTDPTAFDAYTAIRGNLALPLASLNTLYSSGTTPYVDADGHTMGFHPSCTGLRTLFTEDKLAIVRNVGTLVRPTTRAQYLANPAFYRPPQIFSHSDQVTQWQTSIPDQPPSTGWGGRVADLLEGANANPTGKISLSVSLAGNNTFQIGNQVAQYHVSTTGAVVLSGMSTARTAALRGIVNLNHSDQVGHVNLQRTAYRDVLTSAINTGALLNASIQPSAMAGDTPPGTWVWNTTFPTSSLGNQLKMIARLIQARGPTGFDMKRQIFFCTTGGFDTHTAQVTLGQAPDPTTGTHNNLLLDINNCMFAFQRAMEQLNAVTALNPNSLPLDSVTTFTASDFARTLPTNSQGTDHGWGSHHMIMGGAVNGGQTYGHFPTFAINGPDDTGTGRWIPTTSVDQHAATLAKWFGMTPGSEMEAIFPNVTRFSTPDLGFMKPG